MLVVVGKTCNDNSKGKNKYFQLNDRCYITTVNVAYDVVYTKPTDELFLWELVLLKDLQTAQVIHMERLLDFKTCSWEKC